MENKKMRVWHWTNKTITYYPVMDYKEGKEKIKELIKIDLKDTSITDNSFGLEEWNEQANDWWEWEDEETGKDIMEIIDEEN